MSKDDFWSSTLQEINLTIKGVQDAESERQRNDWDIARWQTVALLNIHLERKDKIKKVTDLAKFPWDKHTATEAEKVAAAKKRAKKMDKALKEAVWQEALEQ